MPTIRNKLENLTIDQTDKPSFDHSGQTRKSRWIMWIAAVSVGMLIIYLLSQTIFQSARSVEITPVSIKYRSQLYSLLNATGYVVPQRKADIASKATGRLEWIGVEEGAKVKQGEIIARLENQDVMASMAEAEANVLVAKARLKEADAELTNATYEFKRTKDLIKKKFVSSEAHDGAIARYRKAIAGIEIAKAVISATEASHEAAKVAVEYTLIRAPFDGVILSKNADIGDVVAPFSSTTESKGAVVSMADMETLEVEADVSESNLLKVFVGQPCEIQLDAIPNGRFRGVVNRIVPTVDRSKATVLVKVSFIDKHDRILPDMSAKVSFLSQQISRDDQIPRIAINPTAIVSRSDQSIVFRVDGEAVSEIEVETAGKLGELIIISNGLKSGDKIVLAPDNELEDGTRISIPKD